MPIEISDVVPQQAGVPAHLDWKRVASIIDHTLLKPEATSQEVERLCREAVECGFACAMVNPTYVALVSSLVGGSPVKVGTVIGFPLGATLTGVKRNESLEAVRVGAHELDMVINLGALKSGDRARVQSDIRGVVEIAHDNGALLKVIIETCLLTLEEKILACQIAVACGADYVKTSTGFSRGGATVEDISLMRGVVGEKLGVKASGGIRTAADAIAMIEAGASRIGASSGVAIVNELRSAH
jgi:deoxyribose-phosphate aldolase